MTAIPQTVICRACAEPFAWKSTGRKPHYCTDAECRRRRANDRAYRYWRANRAKGGNAGWFRRTPPPAKPALPAPLPGEREPHTQECPARVERLLQAARAARLRRERETGRRTYVIETGWVQRAGRSTLDGEIRLQEVA